MSDRRRGYDQVEETVERLVELYEQHDRSTPRIQRAANRLTDLLGRPSSVAAALVIVPIWMVGNYIASRLGYHPFEAFPFPDLAFFATVAAFLVALLILTTQRHQDRLAEKRATNAADRAAQRTQDREGHRTSGGTALRLAKWRNRPIPSKHSSGWKQFVCLPARLERRRQRGLEA